MFFSRFTISMHGFAPQQSPFLNGIFEGKMEIFRNTTWNTPPKTPHFANLEKFSMNSCLLPKIRSLELGASSLELRAKVVQLLWELVSIKFFLTNFTCFQEWKYLKGFRFNFDQKKTSQSVMWIQTLKIGQILNCKNPIRECPCRSIIICCHFFWRTLQKYNPNFLKCTLDLLNPSPMDCRFFWDHSDSSILIFSRPFSNPS